MKTKINPTQSGGAAAMPGAAGNSGAAHAAGSPAGPRYGDGTRFDSGAHYALGDAADPAPQGAKVRLDLFRRSDLNLAQFSQEHVTAMTGNANFPTPTPSAPDFLAGLSAFQAAVSAAEAARVAAREATAVKDEARALLELLLNQRGNYVQSASNGNGPVILSSGFPLKNPPSPVGILPAPINLLIELNGTPGVMLLSWRHVAYARSYIIQCSVANTMTRDWQPFKTSSVAKLRIEGLTLGQVYAFRIAAVGGTTGQGDWSAEVVRMAA